MDRLKISTKALLGMATRTVDQEHERRHSCVRALNHAVSQYEVAMSKLCADLSTLTNSLESVEKAYKEVLVNEKEIAICNGSKVVTERIECIRLSAFEHLVDALKTSVSPVLLPLKIDSDACDKIHHERARAVDSYDYNRDVVEKKEVQYASKGKPLDDSKRYKEELSRRDASKEEYLAKHNEYNNTYDQLLSHKSAQTLLSLKTFSRCFFDFSKVLNEETRTMCDALDKIGIEGNEENEAGPVRSEEENQNINGENSESKEAGEVTEGGNGPCAEQENVEDKPETNERADPNDECNCKETTENTNTD